jgi:hypothetical protein
MLVRASQSRFVTCVWSSVRSVSKPYRRDHYRRHPDHNRRRARPAHAGTFTGPAGMFRQTTELTKTQRDLLAKLKVPAPQEDHPGHARIPLTSGDSIGE